MYFYIIIWVLLQRDIYFNYNLFIKKLYKYNYFYYIFSTFVYSIIHKTTIIFITIEYIKNGAGTPVHLLLKKHNYLKIVITLLILYSFRITLYNFYSKITTLKNHYQCL